MKVLHALLLSAGTGLASAKHHKSTSKITATTTTTTALTPSSTPSKLPNIPGCMNTTWINHEEFPTVCQLRGMIQQKGVSGLNNTIFLHATHDAPQADEFAQSLWRYFPNSRPDHLVSLENFNRNEKKSDEVDKMAKKLEATWLTTHDIYQIWKRGDQAFAQECSGTAYIVAAEDVGIAEVAPFQNTSMSYFALYTYPALMRNPTVDQVIQVWKKTASWDNWDGTQGTYGQRTIWKKGMNTTYTMYHADMIEDQTFRLKSRTPKPKQDAAPEQHPEPKQVPQPDNAMNTATPAMNDTLPSCKGTEAWGRNLTVPTVCQFRKMFEEKGDSLKDLVFMKINADHRSLAEEAGGYIASTVDDHFNLEQANYALNRLAGVINRKMISSDDFSAMAKGYQSWPVDVQEHIFQKRFLQAQAMECSGNAYVFAEQQDDLEGPAYMEDTSRSYFSRYYLPALMRNSKITEVFQVWKKAGYYDTIKKDAFDQKSIWKKGHKITHDLYNSNMDQPETHQ